MKGVILAGGKGIRLAPLTEVTNKHLLPVGREPMVWHAVRQMVLAGITDVLLITSTEHSGDMMRSIGSGQKFGCHITYRVQQEAKGIAHGLLIAENFANNEKICVLLADNIFEYSIAAHVEKFIAQQNGAYVLLKEVADPERYGVAVLQNNKILSIEEKPFAPTTNYAVVGCYMYDNSVFTIIKSLEYSDRGELEITAVNNEYIKLGTLQYGLVHGRWTDAGTFESLFEANSLLLHTDNKIMLNDQIFAS